MASRGLALVTTDKDADAKEARQIAEVLAELYREPVTIELGGLSHWFNIYPQKTFKEPLVLDLSVGLPTLFRFPTNRKLALGLLNYGPHSNRRYITIVATEPAKFPYHYALFFEPLEELPGGQTPTFFDLLLGDKL